MLILLSGDTLLGAMPRKASKADLDRCKGEFQIVDKECSIYLSAHSSDQLRHTSICGGKGNISIDSAQVYLNGITDEALDKTSKLIGVENSYVIAGVGMHFYLDVPSVKKNFIDKILELVDKGGSGWPKIVWIGIHNVDGFLRIDTKFQNAAIDKFNDEIWTYLKQKGIPFIRTFEMSKNLKSYDGQHYGVGFNRYKIHLLLNHLIREHNDEEIFFDT